MYVQHCTRVQTKFFCMMEMDFFQETYCLLGTYYTYEVVDAYLHYLSFINSRIVLSFVFVSVRIAFTSTKFLFYELF